MNRGEDLKKDEDRADQRERGTERTSTLDRAHEDAHGDRERRGQHTAQNENRPPCERESTVGLRQRAEELPLIALTQGRHGKVLLGSAGFYKVLRGSSLGSRGQSRATVRNLAEP